MYKQISKRQVLALILSGMICIQSGVSNMAFADVQAVTDSKQVVSEVSANTALVVGQTYSGFKLVEKNVSKDLDAEVFLFKHEKNGGQLVYLANEDSNKWFSIAFKTPPVDQTGVNHIIEHAVLEGSEKYKVKSPFVEMGKRSVNTYMNALTDTDVTYYPLASENDKDFKNLMGIYLDAVFSPNVLKDSKILQQEGWRYESDKKTGKMAYNGVVFSEMKGTLSDPYTTVYDKIASSMYPDTKYRFNSGGEPENIVDLTHAHLVDIYKRYYQPSNACITLYGKLDILERLDYINKNYYSKYGKGTAIIDAKEQASFKTAKNYEFTYPGSATQTAEEDSILSWSVKIDRASLKELIGLSILAEYLGDPKVSLVYKKMAQEADENLYVNLQTDYYQPMFTFILEGADKSQSSELDETIQMALENMVDKGVNKERLVAILNQYEIGSKYTLTSANRGKTAITAIAEDFTRYNDPMRRLNETQIIEQIRNNELSTKFFENLIKDYLLNNSHKVNAVFTPDQDFIKKLQVRLDQKLGQRVGKFTDKELKTVKNNIAAFDKWQAIGNDPANVNTLPGLSLADIDTLENEYLMKTEDLAGGKLIKHTVDSKGLVNLNLMFDMSVLSEDELAYMDLFTRVLSTAGTKSYRALTLRNLVELHTSGIYYQDMYLDDQKQPGQCRGVYAMGTTFLKGSEETVFKLLTEILNDANLKNKSLIELRVSELVESIKDEMAYSTPEVASTKLSESLTPAGKLDAMRYAKTYETMQAADEDFDAYYSKLESKLDQIYKKLFNRNNMLISISSDEDGLTKVSSKAEALMNALNGDKGMSVTWDLKPMAQKTALIFPSEMQYVEMGFNLNQIGEEVSGKDMVFAQLISEGYMYEKIRMKGGAYGGNLNVSWNGDVVFSTYRDPNLKESVEAIRQVAAYLKTMKLTQAELDNAIIAVAGRMGQESDVFEKTYLDDLHTYINYSDADKEKLIKEILSTRVDDLPAFIAKMEKGLGSSSLVVAGSEVKINENKQLFDQIIKIAE